MPPQDFLFNLIIDDIPFFVLDFLRTPNTNVNPLKKSFSSLNYLRCNIRNHDETSPVTRHFQLDMTFASLRFQGTEVLKSLKCQGDSGWSVWTARLLLNTMSPSIFET